MRACSYPSVISPCLNVESGDFKTRSICELGIRYLLIATLLLLRLNHRLWVLTSTTLRWKLRTLGFGGWPFLGAFYGVKIR